MRANFDPDAPYITHLRSGSLHYQPLPAETLHALADIRTLQRHTQDPALLDWLEAREAMLIAGSPDCPPCPVRNVEAQKRDRPRHESKYALRGFGPRNRSGKAKS